MHGTLKARLKVSYLIIFRELRRRIASTHPKKKNTHTQQEEKQKCRRTDAVPYLCKGVNEIPRSV